MPRIHATRGGSDAPIRVFLAAPAYSGLSGAFVNSLWGSRYALDAINAVATLEVLEEHCHVDDARNLLVRDFLESDCTDLIFLDADIGWQPESLARLLMVDKDVVGGSYPLKQNDSKYPVKLQPGVELWADGEGCVEVDGVPTGFLRIRRRVLEDLYDKSKKFRSQNESPDRKPMGIVFERDHADGERIGGDYNFCKKARAAGYKVYVIPEMGFEHTGIHSWEGSLAIYWRNKHGVIDDLAHKAIEHIRAGTETAEHVRDLCEYWGNGYFSAGHGLVGAWIPAARQATGDILECGSGLTSLVAAAANPNVTVWALENDPEWGAITKVRAEKFGIKNLKIVHAPIVDRWYSIPEELPKKFSAAMVDGPNREFSDRDRIMKSGIDLSGALVMWDDMDQENMKDRVEHFAKSYSSTAHIINHPTKNFAVVRCKEAA